MYAKNFERVVVRIALGYSSKEEFLQCELELLGRSGILLRGVESPPESVVAFELVLSTATWVLRGEGRVLGHVVDASGARGAVIRFTGLERSSRELVEYATSLLTMRRAGATRPESGPSKPTEAAAWLSQENWAAASRAAPVATPSAPKPLVERKAEGSVLGQPSPIKDDERPNVPMAPNASSREQLMRKLRDRLFAGDSKPPPAAKTVSIKKESARSMPTQKAVQEESIVENKSNSLYLVAGSKGGVGKSMVTIALVDLLREQGKQVFLVECDNSNPDVWRAHKGEVQSELVNLDDADGWIRLLNICDLNRDHVVVVNTAARNNDAVARFGSTLNESLDELKRQLVTFWVINRQRDSLELLQEFTTAIPRSLVHVVRNGYFGEERKFELYNSSPTRTSVESRGGKSITFADLADRVADDLYSKHLSIVAANKTLPLGNRAELSRWRGEVKKEFAGLLNGS